ncbi:MAG: hypothetical protein ACR2PZ_22250 [Pseudomonadales bacterium]
MNGCFESCNDEQNEHRSQLVLAKAISIIFSFNHTGKNVVAGMGRSLQGPA